MNEPLERRRHLRLERDDKLFIQVLAASETPELVGESFYCTALDASESGLRIGVNQEVAINSEVDLWIDVVSCARKYFLRGLVKWSYELASDVESYQLGIELFDQEVTDYEEWQLLFLPGNNPA